MKRFSDPLCLVVAVWLLTSVVAGAQQPPPTPPPTAPTAPPARPTAQPPVPGLENSKQWHLERLGDTHWKLTGDVEVAREDMTFFADEVEIWTDTDRLVAKGNVVFRNAQARIAADSADFNTKTKLGTFYHASGSATLQESKASSPKPQKNQYGTQEPDMLFYGEMLQKVGDQRYKITKGGFTTCVQPNPRWELTSGSVTLNLDHYAILTNSILRVKGVPLLYLPIIYYPIKKDDRATGFLLPMYGTSTFRGQTLSNAFFWAISRSQDATFMHDWYSKTGQGLGTEYRYIRGPASSGNLRFYFLKEHEYTITSGGVTTTLPARQSYDLQGSAAQTLPFNMVARGRVQYFTDVQAKQAYNTNIYDASLRQRSYGGVLNGTWGSYNLGATYDSSEYFYGTTSSSTTGTTPKISLSRSEKPLFGTPIYFSIGSEAAHLMREDKTDTTDTKTAVSRVDFHPTIRYPFNKWAFLTVNSSFSWHYTFWTDSHPGLPSGTTGTTSTSNLALTGQGISRRYFDMQAQILGPVFTKIWDTPKSGYAEKFKHTIEPYVNLQRTTSFDNFDRIVQLDSLDYAVGGVTQVGYGINSRLFAKRKLTGPLPQAVEILSLSVGQTYYTDSRAAQYDASYLSSFSGTAPSNFSPVSISLRATPTPQISSSFRAEYDTKFKAFRTFGADASIAMGGWLQSTTGWSERRFIAGLPGFNDPSYLSHFINNGTTLKLDNNRFGGNVTFNYDIAHTSFLNKRFVGYYNAQCCGFALEYQSFNFAGLGTYSAIKQDRRINFSITLAGIGSFSNFFGAMGGATGGMR
jgi:LPS-assembly protein